jgi:hypothetical protein
MKFKLRVNSNLAIALRHTPLPALVEEKIDHSCAKLDFSRSGPPSIAKGHQLGAAPLDADTSHQLCHLLFFVKGRAITAHKVSNW